MGRMATVGGRMTGKRSRALCAGLLLGALTTLAVRAASGAPVSYNGSMQDPNGFPRDIVFSGDLIGGVVQGTIVVDGNRMQVTAAVAPDGSLLGTVVLPDGTQLGTFQGKVGAQTVSVSYEAGGMSGNWSAPTNQITGASALVPTLLSPP